MLRSLILIINYKTFVISAIAMIATYVCHQYEYKANFALTFVSIAIVFPIVFSINSAYQRRELGLKNLSAIKGHGMALFFAMKDWTITQSEGEQTSAEMCELLRETLAVIKHFFVSEKEEKKNYEIEVYYCFSRISFLIKETRSKIQSDGEMSRLNQYLSKMIVAFEEIKNIIYYRTPVTLRAYSKFFIYTFPVIYAPYFAHNFDTYSFGLSYGSALMYCFMLVGLDNIQEHLEDPFDLVGEDDIHIDEEEFSLHIATIKKNLQALD